MKVIINKTAEEASVWAARHIVAAIKAKAQITDKPFVLGLPTGGTPVRTYEELVRMYKAGEISFKNVITFNMDEYVALDEAHPESYHSFMKRNFFDHVDVPAGNINILNGNAPDLQKECEEYEKKIVAAGGIDLFLGGVGEDGHLAFNEPYTSLQSRTHVQALNYDTLLVNSRFFDNDFNKVPKKALSVGIATVLDAKEVLIEAFGHKKARAIAAAVEGPITHTCTLSALQNHPNGVIVADELAVGEIKVNTYKFFKEQENFAKAMTVTIIAAVALNGAIGRDNSLLWHLSGDMKFFRQTTTGHSIIMGRRTFESLGRPLPGRRNIVITRGSHRFPEGVIRAGSVEEAVAASEGGQCFVIGGGQIYAAAMNIADKLLITRVFLSPEDADTFFPPIEADIWNITQQSEIFTDEHSGISYRFETYSRI